MSSRLTSWRDCSGISCPVLVTLFWNFFFPPKKDFLKRGDGREGRNPWGHGKHYDTCTNWRGDTCYSDANVCDKTVVRKELWKETNSHETHYKDTHICVFPVVLSLSVVHNKIMSHGPHYQQSVKRQGEDGQIVYIITIHTEHMVHFTRLRDWFLYEGIRWHL